MRDDTIPAGLQAAVEVLREEVAPNDLWRQRLLHRVAEGEVAREEPRRWSVRPWVAIAAGVACMAAGATIASLVVRRASPASVATAPSAPRVRFTLSAPSATSVSIVGDFNGWTEGSLPLRRSADGRTWEIEVPLAPGRYAYSFIVDGRLERDPQAPQSAGGGDDFGSPNSVIMVKGS
jgi:hypothetical protein